MKEKVIKFGLGASLVGLLVLITLLLRWMPTAENGPLVISLLNLYYVPILIAAVLLGESGGVAVALLATVAAHIAILGFNMPTDMINVVSMEVRGAFFLTLASLTARISDRMRASAREWQSLLSVSRSINASLDLDTTLEEIARHAVELTDAEACAIRLLNSRQELAFAKTWGLSERFSGAVSQTADGNAWMQRVLGGEVIATRDIRNSAEIPGHAEMAAEGIIAVLSLPLKAGDRVMGVLDLYRKRKTAFNRQDRRVAQAFAEHVAIAIQNARLYASIRANYWETVRSLTRAIEARDPLTHGHSERVMLLSRKMAHRLHLSQTEMETLEFGAMLHDVGKIGLDEPILQRANGRLSADEQMLIEMHPMIGRSIVEPVEFLRPCIPIIFLHHERWDGGGYPTGQAGEEVPLLARIVALANGYDTAMYQSAPMPLPASQVMDEMRAKAGTYYDPALVEVLAAVVATSCEMDDALVFQPRTNAEDILEMIDQAV